MIVLVLRLIGPIKPIFVSTISVSIPSQFLSKRRRNREHIDGLRIKFFGPTSCAGAGHMSDELVRNKSSPWDLDAELKESLYTRSVTP